MTLLPNLKRYSEIQKTMFAMASLVFSLGLVAVFSTIITNWVASSTISAISKIPVSEVSAPNNSLSVPGTTAPTPQEVRSYKVAPDMPRYLNVPSLGTHSRVLPLGVLQSGAVATPNNVFDVGWFSGSSKPGQPGAMLVDGHVASWTTRGAFYGIKNLVPGDRMTIQRGDGATFTYEVVRSQIYPDDQVDMQSALKPVNPKKPGLNLISCTGKIKPGTSEFDQRIVVYAQQL